METPSPQRFQHLTSAELNSMISRWMEYAKKKFAPIYIELSGVDRVKQRMREANMYNENSTGLGDEMVQYFAEQYAQEDQQQLIESNKKRLLTLAALAGKKPKQLAESTVVSIGGGPGDGFCEPWFPRLAALTGAKVINFDYSEAHPIDSELNLYDHRGQSEGDILNLLLNDQILAPALALEHKISIIECNNLIGNNVSPSLSETLGTPGNIKDDPRVVEMRNNLRAVAEQRLDDNGVLAIDNAYWVKREGKLVPVDEAGSVRHVPIFSEELID